MAKHLLISSSNSEIEMQRCALTKESIIQLMYSFLHASTATKEKEVNSVGTKSFLIFKLNLMFDFFILILD